MDKMLLVNEIDRNSSLTIFCLIELKMYDYIAVCISTVTIGGLLQHSTLFDYSFLSWFLCIFISSISLFYYFAIGEKGAGSSKPKLVKSSSMKDLSNGGASRDDPKAGKSE